MKLVIVAKSQTPEIVDLLNKAPTLGIECEQLDITDPNLKTIEADVVYWRSASITKDFKRAAGRSVVMKWLKEGTKIVNEAIIDNPLLTHKSYQQAHIASTLPTVPGIPTYLARNAEALADLLTIGILSYPVIAKPDHGSQGKGIELISSAADYSKLKDVSTYVFQNYIPNDGDYRIFVVGGVAVDVVIRRATAKSSKSYLNNLSQGGSVEALADKTFYHKLAKKAESIAAAFNYTICGIDLVQNKDTGEIHFMEINSVPQWVMFAPALKQDISLHILHTLKAIAEHKSFSVKKISLHYERHLKTIAPDKSFHYLSRLYLWTRQPAYLEQLHALKNNWLPDPAVFTKLAARIPTLPSPVKLGGKAYRRIYRQKHYKVDQYNRIFFKALFLQTIFKDPLATELISAINQRDVAEVREKLLADPAAIFSLSTPAINFLYHSEHFFGGGLNPEWFIEIAESHNLPNYLDTIDARAYLLTHVIIGASKFYQERQITFQPEIYTKMLQLVESDILKHYSSLSLDLKCEFLVCAALLNYQSALQSAIKTEVEASSSVHGDFIVDTLNQHKNNFYKKGFQASEHRNVLALMAFGD